MRKNEQKYLGFFLVLGIVFAILTVGVLFARGDFKVVVVETNANLKNENVSEYTNLSDSHYSNDYFIQTIEANKSAVVFSSKWCGICNVVKTTLQNEFSESATEPVSLMEADIDLNSDLASKYSITEVPTILLVDGEQNQKVESPDLEDIERIVNDFLQNP